MLSDPHETGVRLAPFRKNEELERYLHRLNVFLHDFECASIGAGANWPIIYVVGMPRSGTTLLSQLICRYLPVGYINNLIARFWLNPVVGIRLSQAVFGMHIREQIGFSSRHGVTPEPWGPHEFGYFWRHWFRLDGAPTHKLAPTWLAELDLDGLRRVLEAMVGTFEAPVLFKNVICGLQAEFLARARTSSLFVLIERERAAVVRSVLRCRTERYGDPSVWWSVKPSTYEEIRLLGSPLEQVERQIVDGARDLESELAKPGVRCVRLSYEQLCADPEHCLGLVVEAVRTMGCDLRLLGAPQPLARRGGA